MNKDNVSTSDYLRNIVRKNKADVISLEELKISLHERGFGFLMLIFSLPLAVPMPYIPGLTTILVLPLIIISVQMIYGADSPWLPKWLGKRSIKRSTLSFIILKSSPFIRKLEKLIKPRLAFMSTHIGTKTVGFIALIFSLSIALPLPLTNLLPAIGIFFMSFGLLNKDGLTIIVGILIGIIGLYVTFAVLIFGKKIITGIMEIFVVFFDDSKL